MTLLEYIGEKVKAQNNANKCLYCGGCVGVCPVNAIILKDTRIIIDKEKCIGCGACVKICSVGAMELK
jgi:Fe-S-cluster-containing hydrogenase component 2